MAANAALVERVQSIATAHGCTAAQVSLAWVLAQGVVPIPGTRRRSRLDENAAATGVTLTGDDLASLEAAVDGVVGDRDTPAGLAVSHA